MKFQNLRKISLYVVGGIFTLIVFWIFLLAPSFDTLTEEEIIFSETLISTDWFWEEDEQDFTDIKLSNSLWKTTKLRESADGIDISSLFRVETPAGDLIFEAVREYVVDKKTGLATHLESQESAHLFFPEGVEKDKKYLFWSNDASIPVEISFQKVESLGGLETFVYTGSVTLDLTEGYSFEEGVPEERRVISEQDNFRIWIEPNSGVMVKYDSSGSNNYYGPTGELFLKPRNKWQNVFDEDTIDNRIIIAQNEKQKLFLFQWVIPIVFLLIAIAFLIIGWITKPRITNDIQKNDSEKRGKSE